MSIRYENHLDFGPHRSAVLASCVPAVGLGTEFLRSQAAPRTPVRSGHLVGAAEVRILGVGGGTVGEVYYPGPYARFQHYELQLRHEHGQALYLETTMVADARAALDIVAEEIGGAGFDA